MPFYTEFASEALASHPGIQDTWSLETKEMLLRCIAHYPPHVRSLRSACSDLTSSASNVSSVLRHVGLRGPDCVNIVYPGVGTTSGRLYSVHVG